MAIEATVVCTKCKKNQISSHRVLCTWCRETLIDELLGVRFYLFTKNSSDPGIKVIDKRLRQTLENLRNVKEPASV